MIKAHSNPNVVSSCDQSIMKESTAMIFLPRDSAGSDIDIFLAPLFSLSNQNLSTETDIQAANGKRVKALDIFAYALAFFKEQALKVEPSAGPGPALRPSPDGSDLTFTVCQNGDLNVVQTLAMFLLVKINVLRVVLYD